MQKTLGKSVTIVGKGLHSGADATLTLHPQPASSGIWFRRVDITDGDNLIPAKFDHVTNTTLCTRLSNADGVTVSTVEHVMAALAGCGIYNAMLDVSGPEIPIMDGSSAPFVAEILSAGVVELDAPQEVIRLTRPVEIQFDQVVARLTPSDMLEIDFEIDFPDAAIGVQKKSLALANGCFVRELSDCRTFCRKAEVDLMQANGLALGGSLENAVVVDGDAVLNQEGFRRADECVRHKMLDAVGDLALAGAPILARYTGIRAGHKATNLLLRALFAEPDAFERVICRPEWQTDLPGAHIEASDLRLSA